MKIEPQNNSFALLLQHQRKGSLLADLSAEMQKVVVAARDHGGTATLTLKITVKPATSDGAFAISDEITSKLPKVNKPNSMFYATDEGALSRSNPNQEELELTVATTSKIDRSPNLEEEHNETAATA